MNSVNAGAAQEDQMAESTELLAACTEALARLADADSLLLRLKALDPDSDTRHLVSRARAYVKWAREEVDKIQRRHGHGS